MSSGFFGQIPYPLLAIVRIAVLSYIGMLLLLTIAQRRYIYHPTRATTDELLKIADQYRMQPWLDDEHELIGWRAPSVDPAAPRLLIFHGNGGYALHRHYFVAGFQFPAAGRDWEVMVFEYPGYGARGGAASETHIINAAQAALDLIPDDERPLYLLGESLGSGVAAAMAAANPGRIAGVILVTPFTCLADVARRHYPIFPVRWLLHERYNSARALEKYRGPAAFLIAEKDEVVPAELGQRLFDGYAGPKRIWRQAGGHNTLDYAPQRAWWDEVTVFMREAAESTSGRAASP